MDVAAAVATVTAATAGGRVVPEHSKDRQQSSAEASRCVSDMKQQKRKSLDREDGIATATAAVTETRVTSPAVKAPKLMTPEELSKQSNKAELPGKCYGSEGQDQGSADAAAVEPQNERHLSKDTQLSGANDTSLECSKSPNTPGVAASGQEEANEPKNILENQKVTSSC